MDWDLFQSLHAVLDAGSLSAAARQRGLTQPTLGRHIEALEQRLGAPLFTRSPRGLQPTELALSLRDHLAEMSAAAGAAVRDASGAADGLAGSVRITASEIMGVEVLPPMMAEFHHRHPEVAIELSLSNKPQDLLRRDADIAVRMVRPTQNALVARKIGMVGLGFYAAPAYVERFGAPQSMDDVGDHPMIGFDKDYPRIAAIEGLDMEVRPEMFSFRSDNDLAQLAAVRAGYGVGAVQHTIARRCGLVPVMTNSFGFELELWVAMHENLKGSRRMRLMFDHLVEGLSAFLAEGRAAA